MKEDMSCYNYLRGVVTVRPEFRAELKARFTMDEKWVWNKPFQDLDIPAEVKSTFAFEVLCGERGDGVPISYPTPLSSFEREENKGRLDYDEQSGVLHFCCGGKWRNSTYEAFVAVMIFLSDEFLFELDYQDCASCAGPTDGNTFWYVWDHKSINVEKLREAIPQMTDDSKLSMAMRMWATDMARNKTKNEDDWVGFGTAFDNVKDIVDVPKREFTISANFSVSIEDMLDEDDLRQRCIEMGINPKFLDLEGDEEYQFSMKMVEQIEAERFKEYVKQERHNMLMKFNRDKKRRRQRCGMRRK